MRRFLPVFLAAVTSSFLTWAVADHAAGTAPARAAVIEDQTGGVVSILIDGKEVARFAGDGLHIRDDIAFGGVLTDVGAANYGIRADGTR